MLNFRDLFRVFQVGISGCLMLFAATLYSGVQTAATSSAETSTPNPSAQDELNRGVDAYKAARYDEAIIHFQKATEMDPGFPTAKIYLATALAQNVVPGLETPGNLKTAQESIDLFKDILTRDPHDVNSLKQIAGIYFSIKKLDDAKESQKKVLAEDPQDSSAAYTIGVIDWTQAHQNALSALQQAGLNDDGEGNVEAPAAALEQIKAQNTALVQEAIAYLNRAIENRPDYNDAMVYLNLVYRRKADLDSNNEVARKQDVAQANEWMRKAMLTRNANEEKRGVGPDSAQP